MPSCWPRCRNPNWKYFARFEIVRRRLFEPPGERAEVEGINRRFSDFHRYNAEKFPVEPQSNEYFERLRRSYPIHPEIFGRLYEDRSTLEKFQRTRGVLQYMAIVIHRLWNSDNKDAPIIPGSLPLEDGNVRNKSIHYPPQGREPVLEREVAPTVSTATIRCSVACTPHYPHHLPGRCPFHAGADDPRYPG